MEKYIKVTALVYYYIIINCLLFAMQGFDKQRAVKGQWRIKEATLLSLGLLGGFAGGLLGMRIFHHKTKKWYFWCVYLVSAVVHIFVVINVLF